eukprot:SAG22_NODE_230_length_14595_cov_50.767660_13_plen_31_part_00
MQIEEVLSAVVGGSPAPATAEEADPEIVAK